MSHVLLLSSISLFYARSGEIQRSSALLEILRWIMVLKTLARVPFKQSQDARLTRAYGGKNMIS